MDYTKFVIQTLVREFHPSCRTCEFAFREKNFTLLERKTLSLHQFVFQVFCETCERRGEIVWNLRMLGCPSSRHRIDFFEGELRSDSVLREAFFHLQHPAN